MSMSAPAARGAAPVPAATSGTGQAPVRVRGLTKRFGRVTALNGLDLTVAAASPNPAAASRPQARPRRPYLSIAEHLPAIVSPSVSPPPLPYPLSLCLVSR